MDPFLVLLHSVSVSLSSSELTELKFLCQSRVGKRKLELVQSGVDLFNVLLEQTEMSRENTVLLRKLLVSLRRQDLLRRLDDFEAGAEGGAAPEERDLQAAFDIICDNVGKDWRKLARHLGVSDAKIEAIEEKYPRNLAEQRGFQLETPVCRVPRPLWASPGAQHHEEQEGRRAPCNLTSWGAEDRLRHPV
nr:FAS-associated death domain protein isoform X2 [Globicephala melas]